MANSSLENYPFFHANISREDANRLLSPRQSGLFLIRNNQHFEGDYTLSLVYDLSDDVASHKFAVEHYRIKKSKDLPIKLTIDDEEYFDNLADLVKHYKADADGLVAKLTLHVGEVPSILIPPQLILEKDKLTWGELIGRGNFSEVFEGVYDGKTVAVKILKDNNAATEYLSEAHVMATLTHPNLVKLIGIIRGDSLIIVTEYMAKGSLLDYLRSRGRTAITPQELVNFARDTCAGMAYLESKNVVHRDLAARNILIQDTGSAKVADFGLARTIDDPDEKQPEGKVAVRWTAPEASLQKKFSSKSDVWSFGILLWEIYSFGRVPYPKILIADVMKHVESGYRMDPPEGCPVQMHNIMKRTWNLSPNDRPSFKELLTELSHMTA